MSLFTVVLEPRHASARVSRRALGAPLRGVSAAARVL